MLQSAFSVVLSFDWIDGERVSIMRGVRLQHPNYGNIFWRLNVSSNSYISDPYPGLGGNIVYS